MTKEQGYYNWPGRFKESQTECLELYVSMNKIQEDELSTKAETISNMENDVTEKTTQTSAETRRLKQEEVRV